ncbi:hypothetical protein DHD05_01425 [Arenibacter sp. N53]|uniref:oligosaccharide flippase family protein n=1 Tax=Arenibacter TaxID=178469 RepID=UPI000CD48524|nr:MULTISPECIES: oligosaccharide flippase family protein [Arenibacter]MCM4150237.1 hypothetical protein [Arenibacter sp. N53]
MATVSKNIFWSLATSLLQVYTGSIVFIVLAKLMPVEDFGILSFGFSLATILWVCADFGLSLMIMKEYPENKFNPGDYVSNGLYVKLSISLIVGTISFIYLYLLYDGSWVFVGGIFILFALASSYILFLQALLKVKNKFGKYTETTIVYAIGITILIIMYSLLDFSLGMLSISLLVCKLLQLTWILFVCRESIRIKAYNIQIQKHFFKRSWSYGFHTILGILYFMIDTQIISYYLGATQVALYQSVFRIILVLLIASETLSNVLLPYMSFKFSRGENISELSSKLLFYLIIIGCSLFLLFTTFNKSIIATLYTSEYLAAIPLVAPLSLVVVLRTISSLLGNIMTISNKQIYRVLTVSISLSISLVLNFIFIPEHGIIAAAWINVIAHISLFVLYFYYSKKVVANLTFFTSDIVLVLLGTLLIFMGLKMFSIFNVPMVLISIIIWVAFICYMMTRNENYTFLLKLLNDRGI